MGDKHDMRPAEPAMSIAERAVVAMAAAIMVAAGNEADGIRELSNICHGLQRVDPFAHDWLRVCLGKAGLFPK